MLKTRLVGAVLLTFILASSVAAQPVEWASLPRPEQPAGGRPESPDNRVAKLAADWIANVFGLPALHALPAIQRFSDGKIAFLSNKNVLSDRLPDTAILKYGRSGRELAAHYDDATKTIYLPDHWTGTTPAEMSVLVHAMAHHFQNIDRRYYDCPEDRKALPYEAQDRWLGLYGGSLSKDFSIDRATLMLITQCMP